MGAYDDIINLPYPTSLRHPRMPMINRAAQFSPFAALVGYGAAIRETARITEQKIELAEDRKAILDDKLRLLLDTGDLSSFTYFLPDKRKDGGSYVSIEGRIEKIDLLKGCIILSDGTTIPIEDIFDVVDKSDAYNLEESLWTE